VLPSESNTIILLLVVELGFGINEIIDDLLGFEVISFDLGLSKYNFNESSPCSCEFNAV
jgi:hypothetical protein